MVVFQTLPVVMTCFTAIGRRGQIAERLGYEGGHIVISSRRKANVDAAVKDLCDKVRVAARCVQLAAVAGVPTPAPVADRRRASTASAFRRTLPRKRTVRR